MNERFGFLSNFNGIKVNQKKKNQGLISKQGELTDNPPLREHEIILTDDDSDEDDSRKHPQKKVDVDPERRSSKFFLPPKPCPKVKPVVNRILESSSSSNVGNDLDKTYCSEVEAMNRAKNRASPERSSPDLLSHTDDFKALESQKKISGPADTIVGTFSDDDLSSRLSVMCVEGKRKKRESNKGADTVVGGFSDISEDDELQPTAGKKPGLADTVVHSSSDDDEDYLPKLPPPVIKNPRVPKPSLPDTIVGFSETMSGLSIRERAPIVEQVEVDSEESDECNESEYDDDVITILDSEEEDDVSALNDNDQPPVHNPIESFQNCSSVQTSQRKTESDTTVNKFFNNPPLISTPERFVTYSDIRRQREAPAPAPVSSKQTSPSVSVDRFKVRKTVDDKHAEHENSFVAEDIVLAETDVSDLHQSLASEHVSIKDDSSEDENTNVEPSEVVRSEQTQVQSQRSTQNQTITQSTQSQSFIETINVSAKIKINVKISMRHSSGSSSSEYSSSSEASSSSSSSGDSQPPPPPKPTPRKPPAKRTEKTPKMATPKTNKKFGEPRNEKQAAATGSGNKRFSKIKQSPAVKLNHLVLAKEPNEDFRTPTKSDEVMVIDDELQEVLNQVYGETWKTPQLLRSCRIQTDRDDLRKSIPGHNFDNFVKNLPTDLESTRITKPINDESKKNQKSFITPVRSSLQQDKGSSSKKKQPSSVKKTPRVVSSDSSDVETPSSTKANAKRVLKRAVKTPSYLEICDPETLSDDESSSEEDFNGNETWNASSDEEYENEQERIKKSAIARRTRMHEEIIFIPDDTFKEQQKKLDDLLDRFEYKKPLGMDSPKIVSKKKLFTHSHYDDETSFVDPPKDTRKEKENEKPVQNLREVFRSPFPVNRKVQEIKGLDRPTPSPKKTPSAKITPKSMTKPPALRPINNFTTYSFLKSLNCEANPNLCNPEALHFRQNFKSKKYELTDRLFKLYNDKVFDGKLSEVPVKWNKKFLNTAGTCNNSRRDGVRRCQLQMSEKVLTSADRLRCTLIHEMCHAATWIVDGENGHGPAWKRWAALVNSVFPELPKISVCHDYVIEYKYTYQCIKCKAKFQTHSKSKKVEKIRCSVCHGAIELFLNKKTKDGSVALTPVSKDVKGFAKFVQMKFKEVKQPNMAHKEVMQLLSAQYAKLTVDEKQNL